MKLISQNKIVFHSKANNLRVYLVTPVRPWPWPHDLDLDLDLDIVKMYLHTKMKFERQGFQKLEPEQDRQTDRRN